jgi:hypothetical protein
VICHRPDLAIKAARPGGRPGEHLAWQSILAGDSSGHQEGGMLSLIAVVVLVVFTNSHVGAFSFSTHQSQLAKSPVMFHHKTNVFRSTPLFLAPSSKIKTTKEVKNVVDESLVKEEASWNENPAIWRGVILGLYLAYSSQFSAIKMV